MMFNKPVDDRLSSWAEHRAQLETCDDPYNAVWEFWKSAPYVPYNHKIDPYYQASWPRPWEIIVENKYDDFTKAMMMAYSLAYTKRFNNSVIEIRSLLDNSKNSYYNIVVVDEDTVINYNDNGPISTKDLPQSFLVENVVLLNSPK